MNRRKMGPIDVASIEPPEKQADTASIPSSSRVGHREEPPCYCSGCLTATAQADQRRAEIDAILERLDAASKWLRPGGRDE